MHFHGEGTDCSPEGDTPPPLEKKTGGTIRPGRSVPLL